MKETVTAHHSYIYTGGQLAQETITTTVTPTDGTSTPMGDIMSSADSSATATLSGNVGSATTTENSTTTTETLYYAYDANGVPMSLTYTDAQGTTTTYYYATNIQGDVTAILDTTGTPVVEYTYDAWGNPLTITGSLADTLGERNSLRYRGYVYDTETGFYYLQSRYYNSQMCRFINADSYPSTGQGLTGNNMFAYCGNNPIVRKDDSGAFWEIIVGAAIGGAIAGAIISTVSHLASCGISGSDVTFSGLLRAAATGAVTGAIGAVGGAIGGTAAAVASVGVGITSGVTAAISTDGSAPRKIAAGVGTGVVAGFGTYLGTKVPVATDNAFTTGFTSFSGGLFLGAQTEIVNVATQGLVSNAFNNKSSASKASAQTLTPPYARYRVRRFILTY